MLYYDRRLAAELLSLLSDGAPLSWLVAHSRADAQTRLEFRRAEGERRYGAIQLYRGRTSPVEVLGLAKGQVKLKAHRTYQSLMPGLFGPALDLNDLQAALVPYLKRVADIAPDAFTGGEGAVHNALMRRYSLLHTDRDPVLLVDSEVRVGFRQDSRHRTGTEHRVAHQRQMEHELGIPASQSHTKLDAVGVSASGELALVEVKDASGDISEAARQLAAHLYTFSALLRQPESTLVEAVEGLLTQKVACGLIPSSAPLSRIAPAKLVAVIAAPDVSGDWVHRWRTAIGNTLTRVPGVPYRVELWRLHASGDIADRQCL